MNNKFSIGVVVAIVLQVSAFVWWTAQQAQTIQTLEGQVKELTAKSEIEKEVQLASDVANLKKDIKELNDKTLEAILSIESDFQAMQSFVNSQDKLINDTLAQQMTDFEERVTNSFSVVEGWIDDLYVDLEIAIEDLDKKLSDRIKDLE
tara:strand:+ start:194 stop:640 length:447 start_codon:yes stop_codon:yes gene_type:complete